MLVDLSTVQSVEHVLQFAFDARIAWVVVGAATETVRCAVLIC